jgi:hypothetical protein
MPMAVPISGYLPRIHLAWLQVILNLSTMSTTKDVSNLGSDDENRDLIHALGQGNSIYVESDKATVVGHISPTHLRVIHYSYIPSCAHSTFQPTILARSDSHCSVHSVLSTVTSAKRSSPPPPLPTPPTSSHSSSPWSSPFTARSLSQPSVATASITFAASALSSF